MGTYPTEDVLRGPVNWEGSFKKAFVDLLYMGTFNIGTYLWYGSISPRGVGTPCVLGSLVFNGGSLANMEMENEAAVEEEETFIIYNLTFIG